MKKKIIVSSVILLFIVGFVFHILISTGFFRTIENEMNGKIVGNIPIAGVEDFTIDEDDNFGVFIAYDRAAERDGKPQKDDGIYGIYFLNDTFEIKKLNQNFKKPLALHGISLIQLDSNHHKLFVINHAGGESIEVFDLYHRDSLVHEKTLQSKFIFSPNDIVAISETAFYFTNDKYYGSKIGNLFENYSGIAKCETVYFDGENYRIVNDNLAYANGINYDKNRNLMYVASPRGFLVAVFKRLENGDLEHLENIDCGTGVDNIEFDKDGNLLIGCHPNLLAFKSFQKGKAETAPSEIIKIAYRKKGDFDLKRIYVNDGNDISASTVAPIYKDLMFVGSVFDNHVLILKNKK